MLESGKYITSISQMVFENHYATEMSSCRPGSCCLPSARQHSMSPNRSSRVWGSSELSTSAQGTPGGLLRDKQNVLPARPDLLSSGTGKEPPHVTESSPCPHLEVCNPRPAAVPARLPRAAADSPKKAFVTSRSASKNKVT